MLREALGRELAGAAFLVHAPLEGTEGDLAHHRVEHVLDLAGQHHPAALRLALAVEQGAEGELLAEDRGGLGQGQRGLRQSSRPCPPAST